MLLWFLQLAQSSLSGGWVERIAAFQKITLRAALAAMISFLLATLLGPGMIRWLKARFREPIKGDSAQLCEMQQNKAATPTMGGLFLIAGLVAGVLLFGDLGNRLVQVALLVTLGLGCVGALDDLVKLRGDANGISARAKLTGQTLVATLAALVLYHEQVATPDGLTMPVPMTDWVISLGIGFVPLAVLLIVGFSNAVNLADGLDGLAGGCFLCSAIGMTVLAYASGHAEWAAYLNLPRIPGAGELTVLAGGLIGGVLGFLWFNCHPAQVFMGDTGSLPLGGLLGLLAVMTRQELLLLLIGGVFVAEAASVLLQVGYYKWRQRRIFLCAPLHHHFQFQGWPETRIVVRFWIASALCVLLGLATLKWNIREPDVPSSTAAVTASDAGLAERTSPEIPRLR